MNAVTLKALCGDSRRGRCEARRSSPPTARLRGGAILHALPPEGTERWKFQPMVDEPGGLPAIASDGTVYVSSEGYGLHALAPDGSLR